MITPEEVEFLTENNTISIVPNFSQEKMYLISGDIGPFRPALPVEVPLWLAINLRQRSKCRILPPDWMDVEKLLEIKENETNSAHFTEMPDRHYMVVTQLIMAIAPDDIPRGDDIRNIIKDISDIRISKLRSSIDAFIKSDSTHAKLNYLTLMELNTVRPFLNHSMDQLYRMQKTEEMINKNMAANRNT